MEPRKQIISVFFFALLLFVIFQLLQIFSPFFKPIFWAAILAYAFYPFYLFVGRVFKSKTLAAFVTTFTVVLIVIPFALIISKNLLNQTVELYQLAKSFVREDGLESLLQVIQTYPWFETLHEKLLAHDLIKQNVSAILLRVTQSLANVTTAQLTVITKNIFLILLSILLVVFLTFFLFRDGEKFYRFIYELTPLEEKDRRAIFGRINDAFAGVIRGQLVTSLAQGLLAGITFFFLALPAPFFFGFLTFLTSMIPITGASTVWAPFAIYLFLTREVTKAVILFFIGVFVISLSDNILKPILIGEKTKAPVLLLFLGIMGGLHTYGVTGIFLGPVFITLFFALIRIYQERYHHPAR